MQKAMFFEEAFHKGILAKVTAGYILSLKCPDPSNMERKHDPFLIEMISYSGVKSVMEVGNGVKFQAQGRKMFCMMEPSAYTEKHIDPTYRSQNTTGQMPFRFSDCESFLTKDSKFNILIPQKPYDCYDSFTVSFPGKGDIAVIYFIFSKNINGDVLPFIQANLQTILNKTTGLRSDDSKNISRKLIDIVQKFDVFPDK